MFPIQELPRTEHGHQRLVHESFFPATNTVITVVASLSFMDPHEPNWVTEWRAYWAASQVLSEDPIEEGLRIAHCAGHGSKLPEEIARAMFAHIDGPYAG